MNRVVAVIVTYNRKNLLIKCIKSIMQQSSGTPDVLIIDNASTDGTKEVLDELYSSDSRVKYMNTGSNLGGAGGFSYGINVAVNLGYDYLWVMDDDTLPENTALEELLKAARLLNDDFGFLSSFVKWTDGSPCVMNIPSLSPFWSEGNIQKQFENHMIRVESASFVSMFIRSEIVRHVGLPIKEFFIWADDIEYALRITKRYKSYYVFDSQVVHAIRNNIPAYIIEEDNIERLKRYK